MVLYYYLDKTIKIQASMGRDMDRVFSPLKLSKLNSGSCFGPNGWSHSQSKILASCNPATEEILAHINLCSAQDLQQIIQEANSAFLKWRMVPAPKRGEIIRQIGDEVRKIKSFLGDLICLEMGKSKQEADGEVQELIDMADLSVGQSRMLYGKTMHSERTHHRMYEQWHPLGVIGVITAFNFPVAVWAWNAFLAAIAGNTVIWKPSPKTPLCAIAIQQICNQVMAANDVSGIFSFFIPENYEIADDFVNDSRIPLLSFTGSTLIGKNISAKINQRIGRCLLEMSGNSAIIIDEDANLKLAIPAVVFGAIGTTGQRCTTTRRLFIHESRYSEVISSLIQAYQQVTIGNPLNSKHLLGPLIDRNAVKNFIEAVSAAKKAGGKVLFGGKEIEGKGFFVEPTLIEAKNEWEIVQKETFAPILYLIPFTRLTEAIKQNNEVRQGLSSAIFTNNLQNAEYFLSAKGSDCGIANVNIGTSGAEIGGAFGGEKETGGGREAGSDAWKTYMRRQTVTINWGHELPLAQGIKFSS